MLRRVSHVFLALALAGCGQQSDSDDLGPENETPPVLSIPMIDLSHVVVFLPFGLSLSSGVQNPAYEFITDDPSLEVIAVTPGVVARILANPQEQGDSEIHVTASSSSNYVIIYDHVKDLRVAEGQPVEAGAPLGTTGNASGTQGRTELQINRSGNPDVAVCPRDLGTEQFNAAHDAALAASGSPHTSVCLASTVLP